MSHAGLRLTTWAAPSLPLIVIQGASHTTEGGRQGEETARTRRTRRHHRAQHLSDRSDRVQLKAGGSATVLDSFVGGTLLLDTNRGTFDLSRNRIVGNLQAFQNTGSLSIFNNTIDENLQCKANTPPPTGGGNIVGGNKEDQCAGF